MVSGFDRVQAAAHNAQPISRARGAAPAEWMGGRNQLFLLENIMFRKFHVKKDERALLLRKGDFA